MNESKAIGKRAGIANPYIIVTNTTERITAYLTKISYFGPL
jgi:hypothetical protein